MSKRTGPGRPSSIPAEVDDDVDENPILVPPGRWSPNDNCQVHDAVDFMNQRFYVGESVLVKTGNEKESAAMIESFYHCEQRKEPMFKCRWYWTLQDIRDYESIGSDIMRPSKFEQSEMISSDLRDSNPIDCLTRKCYILSWPAFSSVRRAVARAPRRWDQIYFCERMFFTKARSFRELPLFLAPGDSIPKELCEEAGIIDRNVMDRKDVAEVWDRTGYIIGGRADDDNNTGESTNRSNRVFI